MRQGTLRMPEGAPFADSWRRPGRLPDRRGERSPYVSGEREYRSAAVGRVADQHGPGRGDFYAFPAVVT